jgi:hypothetical protein
MGRLVSGDRCCRIQQWAYAGSMRPLRLLSFAALLSVASCSRYAVVRQASPNPFPGVKTLAFESIRIGGDVKDVESAAKMSGCFEEELREGDRKFDLQLVGGALPTDGFLVRPSLLSYEDSQIVLRNTIHAELTVVVSDARGQVVDEFTTKAGDSQGALLLGDAFKSAPPCATGRKLAKNVLAYFRDRRGD